MLFGHADALVQRATLDDDARARAWLAEKNFTAEDGAELMLLHGDPAAVLPELLPVVGPHDDQRVA